MKGRVGRGADTIDGYVMINLCRDRRSRARLELKIVPAVATISDE